MNRNMKVSILVLLIISLVFSGAIVINEKELLINRSNMTMKNYITKHNLNLFKYGFASSEGIAVFDGYAYEDSYKLDEIIRIYEKLEGNLDKDNLMSGYAINASLAYWFTHQPYKAIEILEKIDKELPTYIENRLMLSGMYLAVGESTKAHDLIVKCYVNKNNPYQALSNNLMAYSYVLSNDRTNLYRILNSKSENKKELPAYLNVLDLDSFVSQIKTTKKQLTTKNTLSGRLIYEARPVKGAYVYLTPVEKEDSKGNTFNVFTDYNFGVSDERGRYKIENIPNGKYNVCIMVNNATIKNKNIRFDYRQVTFNDEVNKFTDSIRFFDKIKITKLKVKANNAIELEWENPIKDVTEYRIEFGKVIDENKNIINYYSSNKIECKKTSEVVNLDTFKDGSISNINTRDAEGNIDPNELIEPFYTSGKYAVRIYGKPVNDVEYLLCNSKPEFFEYDEGEEYCKGDKLLLNKNYKTALEWFENKVSRHSSDIHALKVLSTLRTQGYKGFGDEALGVDVDKALFYTKALKNYIGSNKILTMRLASLYELKEEYDESMMYYNHLIKGYNYPQAYEDLARVEMKANRWSNALQSFINYDKKVDSSKYGYIVFLSILTNDRQNIRRCSLELSTNTNIISKNTFNNFMKMDKKKYDKFFRYIKYNDMFNAREELRYDTTDLGLFYKALLEVAYDNAFSERRDDQYINDFRYYMKNENNKMLQEILKYIDMNVVS